MYSFTSLVWGVGVSGGSLGWVPVPTGDVV